MKKELKRLQGKNLSFEGKDLRYFVINKTKMSSELSGISDVTVYCIDPLRHNVNTVKGINDTAETIIGLKKNGKLVTDKKQNQFLLRVIANRRKVTKKTKENTASYKVD